MNSSCANATGSLELSGPHIQAAEASAEASARRRAFFGGMVAMLPWLAAVAPFGLIIGVAVADSSMPAWAGWATGLFIYAGSAQLIAVELLDAGAAPVLVVMTVLLINSRLGFYSASIAPCWASARKSFRALAAYLLVDPSYAVGMDGYRQTSSSGHPHAFYLGGALALFVVWQAAITFGLVVGAGVPAGLHLEMVAPLFLVARVVPLLGNVTQRRAALVAAGAAAAGLSLPLHAGVAVGILAGIAAGAASGHTERSEP